MADYTGGFDNAPLAIRLSRSGTAADGFIGFGESRNWHGRKAGEITGAGFTVPLNRVETALIADNENAFAHLEPGLGPFGTDFDGQQAGSRIVDYHTPGHGASFSQLVKVTDTLDGFYAPAIHMGPTVGVGTCIPDPGAGASQSGRLTTVEGGGRLESAEGFCGLSQIPSGAVSAGLLFDLERNANGLLSTFFRINPCQDALGHGRDQTPTCILGGRCDAHWEYDDTHHGPIVYELSPDLTNVGEPPGELYRVHMAPDYSSPPAPASLVWRPWLRLPQVSELPPETQDPPPDQPPDPDGGRTVVDPPPRDGGMIVDPIPGYDGATGGPINANVTNHTRGANVHFSQPAYDRVPSTQSITGLLAFNAYSIDTATGRTISYVGQFDVDETDPRDRPGWGFTLPATNAQIGASVQDLPILRWGSRGEDYYTQVGYTAAGTHFSIRGYDNANAETTTGILFRVGLRSTFEENVVVGGTLTVAGAISTEGLLTVDDQIHVTGTADFDAGVNMDATLQVDGAVNLDVGLTVGGLTTINDDLDVTGAAAIDGALSATGGATISGANGGQFWAPGVTTTAASTATVASVTVPGNSVTTINAKVSTVRSDGGAVADSGGGFEVAGTFRNEAGTVTQCGTTQNLTSPANMVDADVSASTVTMDVSGTTARVRVTGDAGVGTQLWTALVAYSTVTVPA